jgi:hypothetical protein
MPHIRLGERESGLQFRIALGCIALHKRCMAARSGLFGLPLCLSRRNFVLDLVLRKRGDTFDLFHG